MDIVRSSAADATVLVVGLGDLGARVLDALARRGTVGRLIGSSRDAARGAALVGQARLVAALAGGPAHVDHAPLDLKDGAAAVALLARLDPDVIVVGAAEHTWWRGGPALPYGAWLPLQVPLVRRLMEARRDAGVHAPVVCLPYPDGVGPVLAPAGLAPEVGAGNVAEVAAKLAVRAGAGRGDVDVDVRLVLHHAAERVAFSAFSALGRDRGEPPWAAEVRVDGEMLPQAAVAEHLHAPYPLPSGRATHQLTAAAAVQVVEGLLSDAPARAHVPAPGGRPGGYPVHLSRGGIALALPAEMTEADAVAVNSAAAAWDGIEAIEPDGTVVLTEAAAAAVRELVGVDVARMAPPDLDALARELRAALDALRRRR